MGKIKLTHCIGTLRIGGAEKQLVEVLHYLPRDKFEQTLVLLNAEGPLLEKVQAMGWVDIIDLKYQWGRYYSIIPALWRYRQYVKSARPDIIHAWLPWANIFTVIATRRLDASRLVCSKRRQKIITNRTSLLIKTRLASFLERWTNRYADVILCNSKAVEKYTREHERLGEKPTHVICNGVDCEKFKPPSIHDLHIGARIVTVANLHSYKGLDDLIWAASKIHETHPTVHFYVIGRDAGYGNEVLYHLRDCLGLSAVVHFLGERDDVAILLREMDIMVHPSHTEGFCNAITEGMAAGLPVIATAVGGAPEQVLSGINGLLVKPHDPEALAQKIILLVDNPQARKAAGQRSRERAIKFFSMDRMIGDYVKLYEGLVK